MKALVVILLYCLSTFYHFGPCTAYIDVSEHARLRSRQAGSPLRDVYVVADIYLQDVLISTKTGKELLDGHSFIYMLGTDKDGAVRIETLRPTPGSMALRFLDYNVANNDKLSLVQGQYSHKVRKIWLVGQTQLTNSQLVDQNSGKGVVLDSWSENPVWQQGVNDCNRFSQRLIRALGLQTPDAFKTYASDSAEYASQGLLDEEFRNVPLYSESVSQWGDASANDRTVFDTIDIKNPKVLARVSSADDSGYMTDVSLPLTDSPAESLDSPWQPLRPLASPFKNDDAFEDSLSQDSPGGSPSEEGSSEDTKPPPALSDSISPNGESSMAVTSLRAGGAVSNIPVVLENAAKAAGVAGIAIAPAFIILDIVNGNAVGGAFGAVGLALGLLAASALEGPVAWLVAGLTSLFSILPTFFTSAAPAYPHANNATEIIQYAMFGDLSHTGNEKCQTQNPNCTAFYGPGVLSLAFGWNNYDPIVFLLRYNKGYAMTIPEIAAAFHVIDQAKPGDGADQIATISCSPPRTPCMRFNCPGPQKSLCGKATFSLKRELVTLPILNQTADKVFDRLIPRPHGDCKLVNDVSGTRYEDYNITITGSPAAIACNVSASLDVQGTVALINDTNANNGQPAAFRSPGNESTDGNEHQVAAPVPVGLPTALNASNAVCLGGSSGSMCFPNGTYDAQHGTFGFDSGSVNTLTLPVGAALSFVVPAIGKSHAPLQMSTWNYKTNQSTADLDFRRNFGGLVADLEGTHTFDAITPPGVKGPPVTCLFSQTQYHGDVVCYGVGSGNVSADVANVPQSLSLHGNVTAWIYGNFYGDDAAQHITENTPDLSSVPLGADENFSRRIKALWVTD